MISILLSTSRIDTNHLQMPVRLSTNPNVFPSRRNNQRPYTLQDRRVSNQLPFGVVEGEAGAAPFPGETWLITRNVA